MAKSKKLKASAAVESPEYKREVRVELSGEQMKQMQDISINDVVTVQLKGKVVGLSSSEYPEEISGTIRLEEPDVRVKKTDATNWADLADAD